MNKKEFLAKLRKRLFGLPQDDIEERLSFYDEMIDDLIEEGRSEEAAVSEIGTVEDIVSQIVADIPLTKLVKERVKPKRALRAWEIVLLALGSPIWLSLLIVAFAVVFSVYAVMWSVLVSLWAVELSLAAVSLGGILSAVIFVIEGNAIQCVFMLGAGLVCAGLFILLFFGCKKATKGTLFLTKKMALSIKSLFINKEEEK